MARCSRHLVPLGPKTTATKNTDWVCYTNFRIRSNSVVSHCKPRGKSDCSYQVTQGDQRCNDGKVTGPPIDDCETPESKLADGGYDKESAVGTARQTQPAIENAKTSNPYRYQPQIKTRRIWDANHPSSNRNQRNKDKDAEGVIDSRGQQYPAHPFGEQFHSWLSLSPVATLDNV